jgi:hypothetical protein
MERLNLLNGSNGAAEFIVQSIRPPFINSDPSPPISYPPSQLIKFNSIKSSFPFSGNSAQLFSFNLGLFLSAGGIFALLFLLLFIIFIKKHGKSRRNIFMEKKQQIRENKEEKIIQNYWNNGNEKLENNLMVANSNLLVQKSKC